MLLGTFLAGISTRPYHLGALIWGLMNRDETAKPLVTQAWADPGRPGLIAGPQSGVAD